MELKKLQEQREAVQAEMRALIEAAKTEERAMSAEERTKFEELSSQITDIDNTVASINELRQLETVEETATEEEETVEETRSLEQREFDAFDAFLRSGEARDIDATSAGSLIPKTIAQKIIEKVAEMSPIYSDAEHYNVAGSLDIPYYDETTGDITVSWASAGLPAASTNGSFKTISLGQHLATALVDVSKSIINNVNFDLVSFVVNRMARNIALFLENIILNGDTTEKVLGVKGSITPVAKSAITLDDIVELQESVSDAYQNNAYFIMNKATRTALRELKDQDGHYLLNMDAQSKWGYTLLGKDVYTTENLKAASTASAGDLLVVYGDMTGVAVKVSEDINIEVLREVKAASHMVEVVGFVEFDAAVQNKQKVAAISLA